MAPPSGSSRFVLLLAAWLALLGPSSSQDLEELHDLFQHAVGNNETESSLPNGPPSVTSVGGLLVTAAPDGSFLLVNATATTSPLDDAEGPVVPPAPSAGLSTTPQAPATTPMPQGANAASPSPITDGDAPGQEPAADDAQAAEQQGESAALAEASSPGVDLQGTEQLPGGEEDEQLAEALGEGASTEGSKDELIDPGLRPAEGDAQGNGQAAFAGQFPSDGIPDSSVPADVFPPVPANQFQGDGFPARPVSPFLGGQFPAGGQPAPNFFPGEPFPAKVWQEQDLSNFSPFCGLPSSGESIPHLTHHVYHWRQGRCPQLQHSSISWSKSEEKLTMWV